MSMEHINFSHSVSVAAMAKPYPTILKGNENINPSQTPSPYIMPCPTVTDPLVKSTTSSHRVGERFEPSEPYPSSYRFPQQNGFETQEQQFRYLTGTMIVGQHGGSNPIANQHGGGSNPIASQHGRSNPIISQHGRSNIVMQILSLKSLYNNL